MLSKKSKVSKEQAILDAASELFLQRGFKSVSSGEIMQEAACFRETIYRYFSGKEDIFANIISRQMDAYLDTMKAVTTTVGAEGLRDGLLDWSLALLKTVTDDRYIQSTGLTGAGAGQLASGNKREDRYVKAGSPFI